MIHATYQKLGSHSTGAHLLYVEDEKARAELLELAGIEFLANIAGRTITIDAGAAGIHERVVDRCDRSLLDGMQIAIIAEVAQCAQVTITSVSPDPRTTPTKRRTLVDLLLEGKLHG